MMNFKNTYFPLTCVLVVLLLCVCHCLSYGQRAFMVTVDGITRSYLVSASQGYDDPNQPLVIVLHKPGGHAGHSLERTASKKLEHPVVMVFPNAQAQIWSCNPEEAHNQYARNDLQFIEQIIEQMYNAFHVNRNRVFVIGMGESFCLAQECQKRMGNKISAVAGSGEDQARSENSDNMAKIIVRLLTTTRYTNHFERWHPAILECSSDKKEDEQLLLKTWQGRTYIGLTLGRWQHFASSRTEFDTETLIDIAKYHTLLGVNADHWFLDNFALTAEFRYLIIPKEQQVNGISVGGGQGIQIDGQGKGGAVFPLSVGIKFSPLKDARLKPYASLAGGALFVLLKGGEVSGRPGSVADQVNESKFSRWQFNTGIGADHSMSRYTAVSVSCRYYYSSAFDPPSGSVDRFNGIAISLGFGIVIGGRKKVAENE